MSSFFTVQIGRVLSTAGMGSAESAHPYPKATKDRSHELVADGHGGFEVRDRKSGRIVRKWGDGKTVDERK